MMNRKKKIGFKYYIVSKVSVIKCSARLAFEDT